MEVVGLTGGIGCGKSTVASAFAAWGVPVVDADHIARIVVEPGTEGLAALVDTFGAEIVAGDGTLDRKRLAARVFADEAHRRELNAILHPRIAAESARQLSALAEHGHPLALYDAALLVENRSWRAFAGLLVVTAQPTVQRARVMARDGLTEAEVDARVRAQLPLPQKVAVANYVVDNSGTLERLSRRVGDLYAELRVAYGAGGSEGRGASA